MINALINFLADTTKADQLVNTVAEIIRWVANAASIIGAALVTIQIVKAGIKLSQADSGDQAAAAKKKIGYCIFGLVLIVGAVVAVNVLTPLIKNMFQQNF